MAWLRRAALVAMALSMLSATAPAAEMVAAEVLKRGRARPEGTENIGVYVKTREAYRAQWERFGFAGERPPVRFRTRRVVFVATGEPSSCPLRFDEVVLRRAERRLTVRLRYDDDGTGVCTDDWGPRSFVLSLRRAALPRGDLDVRVRRVA